MTTDTSAHDWAALRKIAEDAAASREGDLDGKTLELIEAFDDAFGVDTVLALLAERDALAAERDEWMLAADTYQADARHIADERDALKIECYAVGENYEIAKRGQLAAEQQRDAARAEAARMREALEKIAGMSREMEHTLYGATQVAAVALATLAAKEPGLPEHLRWRGEGPPPPRWTASDGTIVYRSYEDKVDD